MPVVIGLLFHGNFPLSMHYNVAYHSCYKYLPVIMREYPDIPINWHLSAPLLQQLAWKNPETIQIFNEGLKSSQFEILGSSYAQNILYACSEWANRKHIKWNRSIIHNFFPELKKLNGYWNAERVFYKDIVNLLIDYNYSYTLIENDILKKALPNTKISVDHVWKQKVNRKNRYFYFFPDNLVMKNLTNEVIWLGEIQKFFKYLDEFIVSDSERNVICYAEDAEATGFWQIARGMNYKKAHDNLRMLLKELTENKWIEVKLFSDIIREEKSFEIGTIPDGQATWMVESVKVDGYNDWFDYVEKAPEVQYYKEYYKRIEDQFRSLPKSIKQRNLTNELLNYYLVQQFEFGCSPGSFGNLASRYLMNVPGMQLWDDRVTIDVIFNWLTFDKKKTTKPEWKYRGSSPVIEWSTLKWISQFSPFGGRGTLLVNKENDSIFSPNPYFSSQDRNVLFNALPHLKIHIKFPSFNETTYTHGNFLMDDCFVNNKPIGSLKPYLVELSQNGRHFYQKKSLKHTLFSALILPNSNSICFWFSEAGILVKKEITQLDLNINILYTLKNISEEMKTIKFSITNEFSPDPIVVLDNGKNSLDLIVSQGKKGSKIITKNNITSSKVAIVSLEKPNKIKKITSEFAKRHKLIYNFNLKNEEKKEIPIIIN
ncbi:MAG: hypothetical protein ACFFHD_07700 [Promethearchaeota archaeon]